MPSKSELAVYGLYRTGGAAGSVDTEEVALACWELFPHVFSWSTYSEYPDKESVRAALAEACQAECGALVSRRADADETRASSDRERWALTRPGVDWITTHERRLQAHAAVREEVERPKSYVAIWSVVLIGSILSFGLTYLVRQMLLIIGSPEGNWTYPYILSFSPRSFRVSLAAGLVAAALLMIPRSLLRRHEWLVVLLWVAAATGLHAVLRSLTPFTFERIFASDGANSFYSVTRQYAVTTVLGSFDVVRIHLPLHAQSNMPGKLLLVYALERVSTDPGVLAWLVVALSNLGGVLLYLIVRDWFADRVVALFALVLYLFVPAKLYFFPLLNTVTPVVVLGCLWLLVRWVARQRPLEAALLGASLYGLVLFEPLALVTGLVFAAVLGRALWQGTLTARTFWRQGSVAAGGFAAVYVAMWLAFGFDLGSVLWRVAADGIVFNALDNRPYGIWVLQNPLDFFFGAGLCQVLLFWVALGDGLRGPGSWRERLMRPITLLALAVTATLLAVDLIGVNRGEVIRLWIFLACLFQIPAAYACAKLDNRLAMALLVVTAAVQAGLGTSMVGFILP